MSGVQPNRQPCDGLARGGKNGVAYRGRDRRHARFAHPAHRATAVDNLHDNFGRFAQFEQAVGVEVALLDAAVLNRNLTEERRGEPEDDPTFHLSLDAVWIARRTTIDPANDAVDRWDPLFNRNLHRL